MTADTLMSIRRAVLLFIGLVLVIYAIVNLMIGVKAMPNWPPSVAGVGGALVIFLSFLIAGRAAADAASDERARLIWHRAFSSGYWLFVFAQITFGFLVYIDVLTFADVFASMGTLCGGLPLLYYVWLDWSDG